MKSGELWDALTTVKSKGGNAKKLEISKWVDDLDPTDAKAFASLLVGDVTTPEESIGIGKKTMRTAIKDTFGVSHDKLRELEKNYGSLTEAVEMLDRPATLTSNRIEYSAFKLSNIGAELGEISGDKKKLREIRALLQDSKNPHTVVYAILCENRDYTVGAGWKTIRDACADLRLATKEDIEYMYGIGWEIGAIVQHLKVDHDQPDGHLPDLEPKCRIRPMRASSRSIPENDSGWIGEYKYDGGRLLVHKNIDPETGYYDMRAYTRQRREISHNLPEIQDVEWPEDSFIVDSEAVGFDPETGQPLPFQQFMERFQREHDIEEKSEDVEIGFRLFDLIYYDGEELTQRPYYERREILEQNFPDEIIAKRFEDIDTAYESALEDGHEGIIAKKDDHTYSFQRERTWRKLKPSKEPVDLRVTELLPGRGRAAGVLGALRLETKDGVSMGRVGTGFTDEERDELWSMGDSLIGKVVEVDWEELQHRDGKYGLRFPAYRNLRPDGEADTLERLKEL